MIQTYKPVPNIKTELHIAKLNINTYINKNIKMYFLAKKNTLILNTIKQGHIPTVIYNKN